MNIASVVAECIGAANCSLSQLSTVLGKQCWEAVVRNSLIGVAVAAVLKTRNIVGGTQGPFYTIGRLSYPLLIL